MKRMLSLILMVMLITVLLLPVTAQAVGVYDFIKVTHNDTPIRSAADKDSVKLGEADKGDMFSTDGTLLDDRGVIWYSVYANGTYGWISSNLCERRGGTQRTDFYGDKVSIVNGNVNVRAFPDVNAKSVGIAGNGSSLPYGGISVEDDRGVVWHKVAGKLNGWVSSKYSRVGSGSSDSASGSGLNGDTVLVTGGTVNVRSYADANAAKLGTVKKGTTFRYEGAMKDGSGTLWYRIYLNGSYGYISSKYSKLTEYASGTSDAYRLLTVAGGASVKQSAYVKNNRPAVDGTKAFDGNASTAWNVNTEDHSKYEWVEISAKKECTVRGITIINGYNKSANGTDAWRANSRARQILVTCDGGYVMWITLENTRDPQTFTFPSPVTGTTFRFEIEDYYQGEKYDDVCISEILFF